MSLAEPVASRRLHLEVQALSCAESTPVALAAAPIPSAASIKRAEKFVRERFVHPGEDPSEALHPELSPPLGPRPSALRARAGSEEAIDGLATPLLADARSRALALRGRAEARDGTVLSAHQVDALSGTLAALLADAQRIANGRAAAEDSGASASIVELDLSDLGEPPNGRAGPNRAGPNGTSGASSCGAS